VGIDTVAIDPTRDGVRSRRRLTARTVLLGLTCVALALGIAVGARGWTQTRSELDRTTEAVRETRRVLARTERDVAAAIVGLDAARETLATEQATLGTRRTERDAAQAQLVATDSQLADVRASLEDAKADLENRRTRSDALDECLRGVARALNQVSVGDTRGVAATLQRIAGTCEQAGATV
jgi:chromosome segregation ATPase